MTRPREAKPEEVMEIDRLTDPTPENAYVLGLLWADGRIYRAGYSVSLELVKADLDEITPMLQGMGSWGFTYRDRPGRQPQGTARIHNKLFHEHLCKLGYMTKGVSSASQVLSHLPVSLHHMWWRGFFDGDGCLYVGTSPSALQIVFTGPITQDWSFQDTLPQSGNVRRTHHATGQFSQLRITGRLRIHDILRFMYPETEPTIGLSRKRAKALHALKIERPAKPPKPPKLKPVPKPRQQSEQVRLRNEDICFMREMGWPTSAIAKHFGLGLAQIWRVWHARVGGNRVGSGAP